MSKSGRPRIKIDWETFDKLCHIQCSQREIAGWFSCSEDTIDRAVQREKKMGFAEYFEQKRGPGKIALRRKQYESAMSGNVTLLIWLGKQYLEQSDKVEQKQTVKQAIDLTQNFASIEERFNAELKERIFRKLELRQKARQPVPIDVFERTELERKSDNLGQTSLVDSDTGRQLTTNQNTESITDGRIDVLDSVVTVAGEDKTGT